MMICRILRQTKGNTLLPLSECKLNTHLSIRILHHITHNVGAFSGQHCNLWSGWFKQARTLQRLRKYTV